MIRRRIRAFSRWPLWRSIIVVGVIGVMVALAGWYRVVFHSFAFWEQPTRISYCDRAYQTDGSVHGVDPSRLTDIGRLVPIIGWPLLAAGAARPSAAGPNAPCAMVLYLRAGSTTKTKAQAARKYATSPSGIGLPMARGTNTKTIATGPMVTVAAESEP